MMAFVTGNGKTAPLKQLFGFQRVHLKVGQQVTVSFVGKLEVFGIVSEDGSKHLHEGVRTVLISNGVDEISTNIELVGKSVLLSKLPKSQ